jgi:hypothetical protein
MTLMKTEYQKGGMEMYKVGDAVHVGFVGKITAQEITKFNLGACEKVVSRVHFQYPDGSSITAYVTDEALSLPLTKGEGNVN